MGAKVGYLSSFLASYAVFKEMVSVKLGKTCKFYE